MKRTLALLAILSTTFASQAFASDDPAEVLIHKLANGQATVVKSFSSIGNLKGFVVESTQAPKQQSIVYVDKDGKYMVPGVIVTPEGKNLMEADYQTYIASVQDPKIYTQAAQTHWVEDGKSTAPHKAYILAEPNCSACNLLYKEIKPMLDSGELSVRWIFVTFMKPQSAGMVAAIMESKNPSKEIARDEMKFDMKTETGGTKPIPVTPKIKEDIKKNMDFMVQSGFSGTPALVFKSKDGQVRVIRGFSRGPALQKLVNSMSDSF